MHKTLFLFAEKKLSPCCFVHSARFFFLPTGPTDIQMKSYASGQEAGRIIIALVMRCAASGIVLSLEVIRPQASSLQFHRGDMRAARPFRPSIRMRAFRLAS